MKRKVETVHPHSREEWEILRGGGSVVRDGLYGPIEIRRSGAIRRVMVIGLTACLRWIKRRWS